VLLFLLKLQKRALFVRELFHVVSHYYFRERKSGKFVWRKKERRSGVFEKKRKKKQAVERRVKKQKK